MIEFIVMMAFDCDTYYLERIIDITQQMPKNIMIKQIPIRDLGTKDAKSCARCIRITTRIVDKSILQGAAAGAEGVRDNLNNVSHFSPALRTA